MTASGSSCCEDLAHHATATCPDHADPFDCPDRVVVRFRDGSYGLPIRDGGTSAIGIAHCPWCGSRLPAG